MGVVCGEDISIRGRSSITQFSGCSSITGRDDTWNFSNKLVPFGLLRRITGVVCVVLVVVVLGVEKAFSITTANSLANVGASDIIVADIASANAPPEVDEFVVC
jgi:hypothetical protein